LVKRRHSLSLSVGKVKKMIRFARTREIPPHTHQGMIQSKTFDFDFAPDAARPLDTAYAWALKHCSQMQEKDEMLTPMVLLVEQFPHPRQKDRVLRRYIATTLPSFWPYYTDLGNDTKRHCDEVIGDGPCKAYCDFEYEDEGEMEAETGYTDFAALVVALEASAALLIDEVVKFHFETHGVDARPFITRAPKAKKWSMHVVFDGTLWRNARHVGAYMRRLKEQLVIRDALVAVYFDMQVYGRRRCMRLYRSSKLLEPGRSLRQFGERAEAPIEERDMLASFITVFPAPVPEGAPDGTEPLYVTTTFLERFPEMIVEMGFQPLESADVNTSSLVDRYTEEDVFERSTGNDNGADVPHSPLNRAFKAAFRLHFSHYKAYAFKWDERGGMIRVECNSRQCVIAERTHDGNHIYLDIDVLRSEWRHGCHDMVCARHGPTHWRSLPPELAALCGNYVHEWRFIDQFPELPRLTGCKVPEEE
jgi:hypothetical protein